MRKWRRRRGRKERKEGELKQEGGRRKDGQKDRGLTPL
jgi:hypothetical protein